MLLRFQCLGFLRMLLNTGSSSAGIRVRSGTLQAVNAQHKTGATSLGMQLRSPWVAAEKG